MSKGWQECAACGHQLVLQHKGPCPICGGEKKAAFVPLGQAVEVDTAAPLMAVRTTIREYYERRPAILMVLVLLTLAGSTVGLFLAGATGIAAALLLGAIGFIVSLRAMTKVREKTIEKGN